MRRREPSCWPPTSPICQVRPVLLLLLEFFHVALKPSFFFFSICVFFFPASPVSNVIVVQAEKQNEARLHKKIPQIYI